MKADGDKSSGCKRKKNDSVVILLGTDLLCWSVKLADETDYMNVLISLLRFYRSFEKQFVI